MARGMPGRLEHPESSHLVSFFQPPGHGVGRARPVRADGRGEPVAGHPGHDQSLGFHGLGIGLAAPERQPERLADRMGGSLVIGVGMGQRVRDQRPAANLAEDPPAPRTGSRRQPAHLPSGRR